MTGQTALRLRLGLLLHRGRAALFESFVSAMSELGHVEGKTITIEPRLAEGVIERTAGLAGDLVRQNLDLVVAIGAVGARAARNATSTIPSSSRSCSILSTRVPQRRRNGPEET